MHSPRLLLSLPTLCVVQPAHFGLLVPSEPGALALFGLFLAPLPAAPETGHALHPQPLHSCVGDVDLMAAWAEPGSGHPGEFTSGFPVQKGLLVL